MIFAGFVTFYVLSFLWDIFVVRGGYLSLSITQSAPCVERTGWSISPSICLVLLFAACFHAVSLVWMIGFIHSKQLSPRWSDGDFGILDVPKQWLSPFICVPFCFYATTMMIQFGLSLFVFLFLEQLIEEEPEQFVDKFCVGYEETEEALEWLQISLFFFLGTLVTGCIYCCLLRIATDDIALLQPGRQPLRR